MEKEMRRSPRAWLGTEKDVSFLERALHAHTVTTIGLGSRYVLVSSATGEQYFVSESPTLGVSGMVLDMLKQSNGEAGQKSPTASQAKPVDVVMLQSGVDAQVDTAKWLREFSDAAYTVILLVVGVAMLRQFRLGESTET